MSSAFLWENVAMNEPMENQDPLPFLDYSKYFAELSPWQDLLAEQDYIASIYRLLDECLVLQSDITRDVVAAYLVTPSALCSRLPILCLYGDKGTGKSTVGKLANIIHFGARWQTKALSPMDTFASIRNEISVRKYLGDIEKNTIMVWDDISTETLLNNLSLYQLLKVGYDRATDTISMATAGGENISFRVFCPKVISSVSPWFIDPRLDEIQRRTMPIKTIQAKDGIELVSPEEYEWSGFQDGFKTYWQDEQRILNFLSLKKSLIRKGSKLKKQFTGTGSQWAISHDLIACMAIVKGDSLTAIDIVNRYWQWHENTFKDGVSSFYQLLKDYLDGKRIKALEYRDSLADILDPALLAEHPKVLAGLLINPKELKALIQEWDRNGFLDIKPTHDSILSLMAQLGYKLTKRGWEYTK